MSELRRLAVVAATRASLVLRADEGSRLPAGYDSDFGPVAAAEAGEGIVVSGAGEIATVAHMEVTSELLREWLDIYGYDLDPVSDSVQSIEGVGRNLARPRHAAVNEFEL
jgi:hypothetical protein